MLRSDLSNAGRMYEVGHNPTPPVALPYARRIGISEVVVKARLLCALGVAFVLGVGALNPVPAHASEVVRIPDVALHDCVTAALTEAKLPADLVDVNLAKLTWLSCGAARFKGIHELTGLEHLTGLDSFGLSDSTVTDLAPLAAITGLRYLYLKSSELTDGSPLASLPDLHVLQMAADRMSDVSFVKRLTSLGRVSLLVAPGTNFSPLGSLTDLTWLEIAVNQASDLAVITTLDRLLYLTLATEGTRLPTLSLPPSAVALILNATNLSSLEDLPNAPQLAYLEVMGARSLRSLRGIERLTGLGSALIRNNSYADLSPLAGLTGLRTLDISGNAISDLKPLSSLTGLTELRFNANQIRDLATLGGLRGLTILDASGNPATDLSALSRLTSLEWLSLSSPAKDLASLASLSALKTLHWHDLGPTDFSPLAGLPHLASLYLPYGTFTTLGGPGGFTHLTDADFSYGRLASVAGLRDAHELVRLNLHGNAVRDLSPLPDRVSLDAGSQTISFNSVVDAGQLTDLGIRSITGVPICPRFTPTASCAKGVVTYPARGTYTGVVESGDSTAFSFRFTVYVGPDRPFTTTYRPKVTGTVRVGLSVEARTRPWTPRVASYTYQWYRDGTRITGPGSDGYSYTPVARDRGHRLNVCVTGHRATYRAQRVCSARSAKVAYGNLQAPKPRVSGDDVTDSTLTAVPGHWTEGTTLRYQWQRNTRSIRGATAATFRLRSGDVGDHIRVRITGSQSGYHSSTRYSSTTTPRRAAFTAEDPTVTGTPAVGQVLTVQPSAWSPEPTHLSYRWYRNGTSIKGATATTYVLTATDIGTQVTVMVTGTKAGYGTRSVFSGPTAIVVA